MPVTRAEQKTVRTLRTKKGRKAYGLFAAEGVRLLEEAFRFKTRPEKLYCASTMISPRARTLADRFERTGVTVQNVSGSDLAQMAQTKTSQGLLAVFKRPRWKLTELRSRRLRKVLLCENLSDPGNVGTLIRSALAFDFDLVILCGDCAEPFSPKVVRSSVGAVFGLMVVTATTSEALEHLVRSDFALVAAALTGSRQMKTALPELKPGRLALAVGSEAEGLSPMLLENAQSVVRIPHSRRVESLNSAVAGAILMKECYDSRMRRNR